MLYLTLDCGAKVLVKDSRRGRAARWLSKMIYWKECKRCRFPEKPSRKYPPKKVLRRCQEEAKQ